MRKILTVLDDSTDNAGLLGQIHRWQQGKPVAVSGFTLRSQLAEEAEERMERKSGGEQELDFPSEWSEHARSATQVDMDLARHYTAEGDPKLQTGGSLCELRLELNRRSRYADLLVLARDSFLQLYHPTGLVCKAANDWPQCPVFLPPDEYTEHQTVQVVADSTVVRNLFKFHDSLVGGGTVVVVSFENDDVEADKWLVAYVRSYVRRPGYLFIDPTSADDWALYQEPGTLVAAPWRANHPAFPLILNQLTKPARRDLAWFLAF